MPPRDLGLGGAGPALLSVNRGQRPTHAPFPPQGSPRFLLPRHPAVVTAAAVRTSTTAGSVRSRLFRGAGQLLARLGGVRWAPHAVALGGPGTFLHHVQEVLGQEVVASVHLGPPRANRKPVLHLMDHRGRSVAFAKLGMNELTCRRVRNEAEALRRLSGVQMSNLVVPELIDEGRWEGLDYLVMKPVPTDSGLSSTPELRRRAMTALVGAFPSSEEVLVRASWWLRTMGDLDRCGDGEDADRLRAAATVMSRRYGEVAIPHGAGHGDFSPWNVCAYPSHLVVWDWERFTLDVPHGWDELHFALNAYPGGAATALTDAAVRRQLIETSGEMLPQHVATLAYLLNRGVNYLVDRQLEAGARHGPLQSWLLPALHELLDTDRLA